MYIVFITMSEEIHSVILNLNSNFANNTGSNFSTIVNRQLEIKPNTLVALYKGNIVRKPIILSTDTTFELTTQGASFPTGRMAEMNVGGLGSQFSLVTNQLYRQSGVGYLPPIYNPGDIYPNTRILLYAGRYSKLEFCRLLCERANLQLETDNGYDRAVVGYEPVEGTESNVSFPYRFAYEEKDGNFWLGLRYIIPIPLNDDGGLINYRNATTFAPLNIPFSKVGDNKTSNNIVKTGGNLEITTTANLKGNFQSDNWETWAFGNSPIRSMCYGTSDDKDGGAFDVSFAECVISCPTSNAVKAVDRQVVFALHNTYFAEEKLSVGNAPSLSNQINNSTVPGNVPIVQIGARVYSTYHVIPEQQTTGISLYASEAIFETSFNTYYESEAGRNIFSTKKSILLHEFDISQYQLKAQNGILLRYEVYAVDKTLTVIDNLTTVVPGRDYYLRFLVASPYQNNLTVVYDSKNYGLPLDSTVVETGSLFQMLDSYTDGGITNTTGGLCPTLFFKNSGFSNGFKVSKLRSQNLANIREYDTIGDEKSFTLSLPVEGYRLTIPRQWDEWVIQPLPPYPPIPLITYYNNNSQQLENILRFSSVTEDNISGYGSAFYDYGKINPNAYPFDKSINAGITSLGSDLSRYNIELNLPIKTYNTTESSDNDIGQQRTIVFNTDPVIEDTTNFASGLVNKNIIPPAIKWLSLNNPHKIQLNELLVQIRNSKTNKLAGEITDASVELIFKSHNNKSPQLDLIL